MKKQILHFLKGFVPFTLIIFTIHFLIVNYLDGVTFYYSLPVIYLFHILSTLIVYLAMVLVYSKSRDYTGYTFMGGSLLKMMAAVVFLLPMLLNNTENPFANILSFFIPYFLYLIFETIYAVKLINAK